MGRVYQVGKVLGAQGIGRSASSSRRSTPRYPAWLLLLHPTCPLSHQAGYFRLDDINARLKEQVQQAEELVQTERARAAELEQQCERLRRAGGTGLDPETTANADRIEQLTELLRKTERERDQAQRQAAHGGSAVNNDGCFDPTPSGTVQRVLCLVSFFCFLFFLGGGCCAVVLPWHG